MEEKEVLTIKGYQKELTLSDDTITLNKKKIYGFAFWFWVVFLTLETLVGGLLVWCFWKKGNGKHKVEIPISNISQVELKNPKHWFCKGYIKFLLKGENVAEKSRTMYVRQSKTFDELIELKNVITKEMA